MNYEEKDSEQSCTASEPAAVSGSATVNTKVNTNPSILDLLEERIRRTPHGEDCRTYTSDELLEQLRPRIKALFE